MTYALHHQGFTVADLERSLAFYVDVLGAEVVAGPSDVFSGDAIERALGVPGAALRLALVRVGDGLVELHEYREPAADQPVAMYQPGAAHLALRVADIDDAKRRLEAHGVIFNSEVIVNDDGDLAGWRWVFFTDPDGHPMELVELPD